jgi:DNA-binding protein H-NS
LLQITDRIDNPDRWPGHLPSPIARIKRVLRGVSELYQRSPFFAAGYAIFLHSNGYSKPNFPFRRAEVYNSFCAQLDMHKRNAGMTKRLEQMSYRELQQLSTRVNKAMATAQDRERVALREKMESLVSNAGFRIGDLFGRGGKGRTVAVKYANPDDPSQTWTGRGRQPKWLVAKIKAGNKIDRFLIK